MFQELNLILKLNSHIVLNLVLTHRAMSVPFFVEEITGSGKLTTKDYMPTQVKMMPEIYQLFNQFSRSGSGGSVINWLLVSGS